MTDIEIKSSLEFIAFCESPKPFSRLVFRCNQIALPPQGVRMTHGTDIIIAGETAPNGRLLITGGRFTLLGCENITISKVGFRIQRLKLPIPTGLFETYERSWKSFAIHALKPEKPCRNITLRECSFSGHTDEIEAGPADHASWFSAHPEKPAVIGLTFDRCIFGPSFINTGETIKDAAKRKAFLAEREYHNMSISVACGQSVAFNGCIFVSANRRSPQIAGTDIGMSHCVVDSWGSMALGLHSGADVDVNACHFMRGQWTNPTKRAAGLVEGTELTPFAKLGPATLAVSDNTVEYNQVGGAVRKGFKICHSAIGPLLQKGKSAIQLPTRTIADIVGKAGCGDILDVAIRKILTSGKHVPWVRDYTSELPMPVAR